MASRLGCCYYEEFRPWRNGGQTSANGVTNYSKELQNIITEMISAKQTSVRAFNSDTWKQAATSKQLNANQLHVFEWYLWKTITLKPARLGRSHTFWQINKNCFQLSVQTFFTFIFWLECFPLSQLGSPCGSWLDRLTVLENRSSLGTRTDAKFHSVSLSFHSL